MRKPIHLFAASLCLVVYCSVAANIYADSTPAGEKGQQTLEDSLPVPVGGWEKLLSNMRLPKREFPPTRVVVGFHVNAKGRVVEAFIIQGGDEDIDDAVLKAFRNTQFSPAIVNGKPEAIKLKKAINVERQTKAEPGATDNPDDAQR